MSRYQLTDRMIGAAPALYEFVEEFVEECERNRIGAHEMPLLRKARMVAAQANDRSAAVDAYKFVEEFVRECERQGISSHQMPLLKKARFVAAQAGDRTGAPAKPLNYACSRR